MKIEFYLTDVSSLHDSYALVYPLLTAKRRERIDRIRSNEGKLRLMGAGLLLRSILDITDDAQLTYNGKGKPFLKNGPYFSLSHSGNRCALAVCESPVGTDIEIPREIPPSMFRRCLQEEERAWCSGSSDRFLRLWTRKESIMKFCGDGIGIGFQNICTLPDHTSTIRSKSLSVKDFQIDGCFCAVACEDDFDIHIQRITVGELIETLKNEA